MKYFFLALSISVSLISHSKELKIEEKKDFIVLCAISKSAEFLSKDKYFTDKAERVVLISSMIEKNIKTEEVKNVVKSVSVANPSQKVKMMEQAARDVGFKIWNCPSAKFLY